MSVRSTCGRAWPGATKKPYYIRRLLTEGAAQASDKRAVFVGAETYDAAGGVIARDLFQHDGGGWFEDVALDPRPGSQEPRTSTAWPLMLSVVVTKLRKKHEADEARPCARPRFRRT